jgi:hypothetical protein
MAAQWVPGEPGPMTLRLRKVSWDLYQDPSFAFPVRYD